jgi:HEPN domain-containing protein
LIPVVTQFNQLSGRSRDILAIKRPDVLSEDSSFVFELGKVLQDLANEMGLAQNLEPRRLFEAKEYRAAVTAAMTLLEATLRQRLSEPAIEAMQRPMSMRQLLSRAAEENILKDSYDEVLLWTKLRNDAVHTAKPVTRNEAKTVVEGVERILGLRPSTA